MKIKDYARIASRILKLIFWMIVGYLAGDLGFGFYFVSFMVFYLAMTVMGGGIKIAVAKMVEVRRQKELYQNCKLVFKYGLLYSFVSGLILMGIFWFFSGRILETLTGYRLPESVLSVFGLFYFVFSLKSFKNCFFFPHFITPPQKIKNISALGGISKVWFSLYSNIFIIE